MISLQKIKNITSDSVFVLSSGNCLLLVVAILLSMFATFSCLPCISNHLIDSSVSLRVKYIRIIFTDFSSIIIQCTILTINKTKKIVLECWKSATKVSNLLLGWK